MGAPKLKWTPEEEAALKAGITKYGLGKWSTILKDPEFSTILRSRSNVDLKDKWRNINVMANGWGSRQRGRLGYKNPQQTPKHENITMDLPSVPELVDAKPLSAICEAEPNSGSKKPISRLDDLIIDAIAKLKEPRGSNRAAISLYIEERYSAPPNFERLLAANLKLLTENGRLIKVKHQYRIAPSPAATSTGRDLSSLLLEGVQKESSEKSGTKILTKAQIDAELEKMRGMTAQEAAAAAAQAVAEAEAAVAEAELAAREAEEAEAEAEAAQCFAEAAMKALKCSRTILAW